MKYEALRLMKELMVDMKAAMNVAISRPAKPGTRGPIHRMTIAKPSPGSGLSAVGLQAQPRISGNFTSATKPTMIQGQGLRQ
jgi:hypothetical protein